ncbi:MiaB/RimO family radical SAM methylthiotransferase [Patescibacteria group bacterium]|nr:MiaB/RimO family radical SAM methylthiotransferase [Patescibacteria group bacterium]
MKYFVKTFGCQMNESDSERISSFLEDQGYINAKNINNADLIIVNACSVRQTAIDRILGLNPIFKKLKAKKILTGCVLKQDKSKFEKYFDEILSIQELLGQEYFKIRPKYLFKESAFVPIMTGCNNYCSYCAVPYVRGKEISRKPKEIIKEIKELIKKNYKQITLLGQNVNSYKYGFSKLLKELNNLQGNFKIHFLTNHPKDMSDELINTIAESKKIAKEIHLPLQSGDDNILKKMNRKYTKKQYLDLIKKIKKAIRNVKISTDVIVGFPGETKKQFENTVKVFKKVNYDTAYINKYSTRQGTESSKLKDNVSWNEKKQRWKILNNLIK